MTAEDWLRMRAIYEEGIATRQIARRNGFWRDSVLTERRSDKVGVR